MVGNSVHTVAYRQRRDRGGTRCGCPTVEYRMVSAVVGVHLRAVLRVEVPVAVVPLLNTEWYPL